jgi:hypothetical protein
VSVIPPPGGPMSARWFILPSTVELCAVIHTPRCAYEGSLPTHGVLFLEQSRERTDRTTAPASTNVADPEIRVRGDLSLTCSPPYPLPP